MLEDRDVAAYRAGQPDGIRAVYREYGRLVFAVTYRVLGDRSMAEEATQQTFVQAWKAAGSFDPAASSGHGWPRSPGGRPSTSTGGSRVARTARSRTSRPAIRR